MKVGLHQSIGKKKVNVKLLQAKRFSLLVVVLILISVMLFNHNYFVVMGQESQPETTMMPPTLDGIINPNEYVVSNNITDTFKVYVSVIGPVIYFGIIGHTDGWVSIGIEPDSEDTAMRGADVILGWVSGNKTFIVDAYATDVYDHEDDQSLGGTFDIIAWNGREVDGVTTLEFVRLLNTTDTSYDKAIAPDADTLFIMWAIGPSSSDNNKDAHDSGEQNRGYYTLALKSGVTVEQPKDTETKVDASSFLLFHSIVGFLLGIVLYVFVYFPTVAIFVKRDLQELVIKRKLREYPRVVEKPRIIEEHPRDSMNQDDTST